MSMQVTSLSAGSNIAVPAQKEQKPPPLPMERKIASTGTVANTATNADEIALAYSGTQKPQTPDLNKTASDLEHIGLAFNRRLKFIIDQESRELIVKVIDNETDKVIKVLPPEELQRLHSRIRETMGFLFDRMV